MLVEPWYVASGLAVGTLVGMTGVGGGSLMTPLLVLLFGVHPATAVGTDLLYAALTKSAGTLVHGFNRTIDWKMAGRLAAGSVPATMLSMLVLTRLRLDDEALRATVTTALGMALLLTALALLFRARLLARYGACVAGLRQPVRATLTVLTGAALGLLVSLSSVGAGAIGVTVLILLYPEMPPARIIGSDIAHAVPLTFVAGTAHWLLGSVDLQLLGSLLLGSIPGIVVGSHACLRVSEKVLRPILAGTLLLVAGRLLI